VPELLILVIDTLSPFCTVTIADIDGNIPILENSLSLYTRSHPEHIICVYNLAELQLARYRLLQERDDLDKFIVRCTEAILLPSVPLDGPHFNNVFQLLFHLAFALLERGLNFDQHEGIKYCVEYLRYLQGKLRGLPIDSFDFPTTNVTKSLIWALTTQVELDEGDGTRNIEEMLVLCRELLDSKLSAGIPFDTFLSLNMVAHIEYNRGRAQSLDRDIECLRDAAKVFRPDSARGLLFFGLARILWARFWETYSHGDYEEAMALLEMVLCPNQPGGFPDSLRDEASLLATELAHNRSTSIFPQYTEISISRLRTLFSSTSVNAQLSVPLTDILAMQARERFRLFGPTESLEEANTYTAQLVDPSSSQSLENSGKHVRESAAVRVLSYSITGIAEKIQHLEELLSIAPPGTEPYRECLSQLTSWHQSMFHRTNDILDIEGSLKYSGLLLDAPHPNERIRAHSLCGRYQILLLAFNITGKISYLNESITVGKDILELKSVQEFHLYTADKLAKSLLTRERLLGQIEDRHEAIRLITMVIDNQHAREPDRFALACNWATHARSVDHPTTLIAYKTALLSMKKSFKLSFAPTVSIQHTRLVAMGEACQTMPLDYASFQIHLSRFEEAIETLEQGRALIWSEMRNLRIPMSQNIEADPPLAMRLTEINQELESITTSIAPSVRLRMDDGVTPDGNGTGPFGQLVGKQRKLVEERDALISQIQGQPGFEGFLKMPPFGTLRSAASRGPIILINHCRWRSDILIIFHHLLPCSIPNADDFYARANKLRDELVEARKHGLDSDEYQDALCSVLKDLYGLVGEPVIKRLRMLGVPEQSRIWWCPTSVFCSLPLHAMGPIPSNDAGRPRYFSDLYVPSYTPSLSALIESRRASPQMLEKPSLLLVDQPEDLPSAKGEIEVIQRALKARVTVKCLVSSESTPPSVVEGLRGSQFAHFACHGVLETGKPFEACFKLHGGSRLTLLDIVQSRLPDAEFAFLSCCHAAEITEDSIADEALHLTAAMQYCGFRSVVGTMWAMADTDGQGLAKSFYGSLFSSRETGVPALPYYERSAHALRDATQKLRMKRGITLERWVNFVHYGA
jgi:CHAT domain-containing protein